MKVDGVVRVRKDVDVVVFYTGKVEFVEQGERVLHVHVVVGDAVHEEEADVFGEGVDVVDGRVVVAGGVVLGCVHVPFRVDGVCSNRLSFGRLLRGEGGRVTVESPICNGRNGHAIRECSPGILFQCLQSHEPAVTPPPDCDSLLVDVVFCCPNLGSFNLVVGFPISEVASDCDAGCPTDESCSSAVDSDDDVFEPGGNICLVIYGKALRYLLAARSTVHLEQDGVLPLRVKVGRPPFDNLEVESVDVYCGVVERWKFMLGCLPPQEFVLFNVFDKGLVAGWRSDNLLPGYTWSGVG